MNKNHPTQCFVCESGRYIESVEDFPLTVRGLGRIIIDRVPILRCNVCGEEVITPEASRRMEGVIDTLKQQRNAVAVV